MKLEYLLFNGIVILSPLLAISLLKNIQKPQIKQASIATGISATLFILWDILVTPYFWSFNPAYTLGIKIGTIPIEEALFFITVPFACLLLHINIEAKGMVSRKVSPAIPGAITVSLLALSALTFQKRLDYTSLISMLCALSIIADMYILKTKLLTTRSYYIFLATVLLLTAIFNLYLTYRPIVIYNDAVKTNINLITIPIEDFIYGLTLMIINTTLYKKLHLTLTEKSLQYK